MEAQIRYNSIEDALTRYPGLKSPLKAIREAGLKVYGHVAKFTKRGAVSQHLWLTEQEQEDGTMKRVYEPNQTLHSYAKHINHRRKQQEKERSASNG